MMDFSHVSGVKPAPSIELGRGADGIVVEVLDRPELALKDMNHPFKLGRNRIALEQRECSTPEPIRRNGRGSCANASSTWSRAGLRRPERHSWSLSCGFIRARM